MSPTQFFLIGTRGSPLALAQANETKRLLEGALAWSSDRIELKIIRTSGDRIQDRPLAEAGGKGLFTKEIDAALLAGEIDAAVHSAKDLPTALPEGIVLAGFLPREDVRDALISSFANTVEGLPRGATFGAASLRRQAQALRLRPDLKPELLRGNVETRLRKAETGAIGATLLAMAGLRRLGLVHRARAPLSLGAFLPAAGQGAIALTARSGDARALEALGMIADADAFAEVICERAFLAELEGSCRTPIAALARVAGDRLRFRGQLLSLDGVENLEVEREGERGEARRLGCDAGRLLKTQAPEPLLEKHAEPERSSS